MDMICIKCHHENTRVVNSRPHKKRSSIWRRRMCGSCGSIFTTLETVSNDGQLYVRHAEKQTVFSLPRLLMSIAPILSQQSTAPDDAYWLAMTAYEKAFESESNIIAALDLTSLVFTVIERFDSTAALKYALDHKLTKLPSSRAKRPRIN